VSGKKDISQLVEQLKGQGWRVVKSPSNSHYKCFAPGGDGIVFLPLTPSDWRSIANCRASLRKFGAKI